MSEAILHKCIICEHAKDFCDPMSMLTKNNLMLAFTCERTPYGDAYSQQVEENVMIYNMINGECWVDGGTNVPKNGCPNYTLKKTVNVEVEKHLEGEK